MCEPYCSLAEAAVDVPCLDPFEEEEEKEFSLRLNRGASFTSMASSAAGETQVSWGLSEGHRSSGVGSTLDLQTTFWPVM